MSARQKSDHPGYSFERAPWALVTGVEPLNWLEVKRLIMPQLSNTVLLSFVTNLTAAK